MKNLLFALLIFTSSSVFAQSWWNSKKVKGNGNVVTEKRSVGSFDDVSLSGSFDVVLIDGKEGKITLEGEENILPYIITEVKGGTLKIKVKKNTNLRFRKKLTVTVPFEDINGLALGGSGSIISKKTIKGNEVGLAIGGSGNIKANVKAETVKASIGGSGNIDLKGTSDKLKCSVAGSGNIRAYDLTVSTLRVSVAGSGDVEATVTERIKASIAGSGSVYYKGSAKYIDTSSVGSGDVVKRD
ncbi:head GIN domain-containing protein [Tenacibaculum sp. MEBiC06402]|uniref:head GIN domain-containing protein n=1 Tax=unclassified Tenacibaculum TaxID=2635139 RepID=UPI003B9CA9BC